MSGPPTFAALITIGLATPAAPAQPVDGAAVFAAHCVQCHGAGGRGDGPASALFNPAPHDLTSEPLRFAATGGSMAEVIRGLESTISRGLPRTGMPGYGGVLSKPEIEAVARHILALGPRTTSPAPDGFALKVGPQPEVTPALTTRGAVLFRTLACVTCHGERGMGDGEGAKGLLDTVGRPIRPADLGSGRYMAGDRPEDLYRVILMGVPGTPMAGYKPMLVRRRQGGVIDDWDAWAVVEYVKSLRREALPRSIPSGSEIQADPVADSAAFEDPTNPAWDAIPPTNVDLFPMRQRLGAPLTLQVRAAKGARGPMVRLAWADESKSFEADGTTADGASVLLGWRDATPQLPLGEALWAGTGIRTLDWSVRNGDDPNDVSEHHAYGMGQRLNAEWPSATGKAVHTGASWALVLQFHVWDSPEPYVPAPPDRLPIAFAVWDGGSGESETSRLFTAWHWLKVAP